MSDEYENQKLFNFLKRKSINARTRLNYQKLSVEFAAKVGTKWNRIDLMKRMLKVTRSVPANEDIDEKTRVRMLFALRVPVNGEMLERLRQDAQVLIDQHNRIISYNSNDGTIKLASNTLNPPKTVHNLQDRLFQFLAKKVQNETVPLKMKLACEEFHVECDSSQSVSSLISRVCQFRQDIPKMRQFDMDTKVKLLFGLSASVDASFLELLRKRAHVQIDGKSRIKKYEAYNGALQLEGNHVRSHNKSSIKKDPTYTPALEENEDFIHFLTKKAENSWYPIEVKRACEQFKEETGAMETVRALIRRVDKYRRGIYRNYDMDIESKVKMMYKLSAPVEESFLEVLREDATVELDKKHRLIKYKANDGSLFLQGDHSLTAKRKAVFNNIKAEPIEDDYDDESYSDPDDYSPPETKRSRFSSFESRDTSRKTRFSVKNESFEEEFVSIKREEFDYFEQKTIKSEVESMVDEQFYTLDNDVVEEPEMYIPCHEWSPKVEPRSSETAQITRTMAAFEAQKPIVEASSGGSVSISVSDHIQFLESIKTICLSIDLPCLQGLQSRIDKKIEKFETRGAGEESVTFNEIRASIHTSLQIITKRAEMELQEEENEATTSLKEFLLIFRTSIISLKFPILEKYEQLMKGLIGELAVRDKKFPINKIKFALQIILDLIAP